ncbi:unnamed protein product [Amoebophrya sp. A25]|nr:unnamed protein product [Amoebophrya sp. A25]|eukprot:GSA25T00002356001.1
MRSVAAARTSGGGGPAGRGQAASALSEMAGCTTCKDRETQSRHLQSRITEITTHLRETQDQTAHLSDEISELFRRYMKYKMGSAHDVDLLTEDLKEISQIWQRHKERILSETGSPADGGRSPRGGAQRGAFFAARQESNARLGLPLDGGKDNFRETQRSELHDTGMLEESIFYGTNGTLATSSSLAEQASGEAKKEYEDRVRELLFALGAHKMRCGMLLSRTNRMREKQTNMEQETAQLRQKLQKQGGGRRRRSSGNEDGAGRKGSAGAGGESNGEDDEDSAQVDAGKSPRKGRDEGKQRKIDRVVKKLEEVDGQQALVKRKLAEEMKARITAEEEASRLRNLLDRLRKSNKIQRLPEIQEANRLMDYKRLDTRGGSTDMLQSSVESMGSPTAGGGSSISSKAPLVDRKYKTREREHVRVLLKGMPTGPGAVHSREVAYADAEKAFSKCPVEKLRKKREAERQEEEKIEEMRRLRAASIRNKSHHSRSPVNPRQEPYLARMHGGAESRESFFPGRTGSPSEGRILLT